MGAHDRRRTLLRAAAGLLAAQAILMEATVAIGVVVLLAVGVDQATITDRVDVFALDYLQDNLYLMMALSGVFAALRLIGAVGLWRNRLWGLRLSLVDCGITLTLMLFLLPPGLIDGLLSGAALVLMLVACSRSADGRPRPIVSD